MRIIRTIAIAVLLAGAAVTTQIAAAADAARDPVETAAAKPGEPRRMPPATAPAPVAAGIPAVRAIEADGIVSGSEADPETFDRQGLETWWREHLHKDR